METETLRLLPPSLLHCHNRKCSLGKNKCDKCAWYQLGPKRRRQCQIPCSQQTWLACSVVKKKKKRILKLGCVVCHQFKMRREENGFKTLEGGTSKKEDKVANTLGNFEVPMANLRTHVANLYRHGQSSQHVQALLAWGEPSSTHAVVLAPSAREFEECLDNLKKGVSARDGKGTSDKKDLMRWALTECILERYRNALKCSRTLVLVRDERHQKLLVRFRATLEDMSVVSGCLGVQHLTQGKAQDIVQGTNKIIRDFCTQRLNPPRLYRGGTRDVCDEELVKKIHQCCEVITTDSAAAEILAQEIGRGKRAGSQAAGPENVAFPNIKIIGRDRAHACQRLLRHPWKSDPVLRVWMEAGRMHVSDRFLNFLHST